MEEKKKCMIIGCNKFAEKRLNRSYKRVLDGLNLKLDPPDAKELLLCRRHYKLIKDAMRALKGRP